MMSGKFAGDVSPRQAWEALAPDRSAVLIDVYTTYSVREGFEGQLDDDGHRVSGGWKSSGLPWEQS